MLVNVIKSRRPVCSNQIDCMYYHSVVDKSIEVILSANNAD